MSNNLKPTTFLFYFGTAILLSLILVTGPINLATAQDDEDDNEQEEDKDSKDEDKEEQEEEQSEADKTKELLEQEKQELEELEEQKEITEELNETTQEQQVIQQQLNDLLANNSSIDQILNDNITLQPVEVNTPPQEEPSTVLEQPAVTAAIEKQFNATCNCFATNVPEAAITKTPTTVIPQQQQQQESGGVGGEDQQIPITKANIKNSKSFGQVTDPGYTGFYTVSNLLDNTVNDISFWSQAGKSSFYIELDSVMDNYQVCSAELIAHNPKGIPYLLDVGVSKNYTGIIDQMNEQIKFDKCVKNMDEIFMMFDSPDNSYVSIAEMQFFGKKLNGDNNNPTPQEPDPTIPKPPQPAPYKNNMTKINITNSEAEINIQNSTVTFKFDPQTAKATGYNIITSPNADVVN